MLVRKYTNKTSALVLTAALIMSSCQSGQKPGTTQVPADSTKRTEIAQEVKEVVYPLPTPFEMTKMLSDIDAKYVSSSLNPASKVEKYFTEKSKAFNLGVYCADLAYAATYDKKQDIKLYSSAVKKLNDDLGTGIDYNALLSDEMREKANNKDSLANIITSTFFSTYNFLNEKGNPDYAIMMVSGMWVELMYIATNISEDTYHMSGMVSLILKQKDSYSKLMKLIADRSSNADIKAIGDQLQVLKPVFDKEQNGVTEADYKLILKTIKAVRTKLVS
jgi:hypothetical protein